MGETPKPAASIHPQAVSSSKYHTLMELGRGGTAVVHAALARGLGGFSKLVVLKMTRQELADHPEAVRMFLNEARLSARMNHPNVVQVYEVFEDQGLPVIVMEYLEGQSFAALLRRLYSEGDYPIHLALSILCKALEGLHYAHSLTDFSGRPLKIIHRDVTPHNIIVTYDGQVKLLDFGIAKLDAGSGQTRTGIIKGKLGYMPREQIDGSEMDGRTDIFAIGVILWEVVARQRMWGTLSDATVMKHLLCDDIPRLRDAVPDVDEELEAIINRAIAPERDDRYASAHDLHVALSTYLTKHGGLATQAAIAEMLNKSCADLKAESRKRLDRELAKFSQSADGEWNSDVPAEFTGTGPRAAPKTDETNSSSWKRTTNDTGTRTGFAGQTQSTPPLPPKPRRWPMFASAAALVLGGVAVWQTTLEPPPPVAEAPAPAVAPVEAPVEPAAPTTVHVLLEAKPPEADIYLDGVKLPSNPYEGTLPADEAEHELRVTAEGFTPASQKIRLSSDVDLNLTLVAIPKAPVAEPAKAEPPTARRRPVRTRRHAPRPEPEKPATQSAPVAATQPPVDNCSPPYYIDEHGIKRYKRDCLGK